MSMSDPKRNTQQIVEMAKFLNVYLTPEQVVAVEKMLAVGVPPIQLVRFLQSLNVPTTQSPGNRENVL